MTATISDYTLLCSTSKATSVMIHHRGASLSKQQTDLSLHNMPPMEADAAYQGCLKSCELHSRSLAVGCTGAKQDLSRISRYLD